MNKKLLLTIAGIALLVIGVLIGFALKPATELTGTVSIGQRIFPDGIKAGSNEREIINAKGVLTNIIYGGGMWVTSTGANATTTAANICKYDTISVSPVLAAGSTVRFPATSTLYGDTGCLFTNGDRKDVYFYNATTGASTVTVTFDVYDRTGIQLMGTSTSAYIISPTEVLKATFWRNSIATTSVFIELFRDSD